MRIKSRVRSGVGAVVAGVMIATAATAFAGGMGSLVDDESRFYLAPIIGASWSTLSTPGGSVNTNLFTAGGAAGVAVPWEAGQLRFETEARYRDSYFMTVPAGSGLGGGFGVNDNWSVLTNFWRDFSITRDFGIYAGAGIGGGGYAIDYRLRGGGTARVDGHTQVTNFAWQAGGGMIFAVSDRITLDLGYRFYNVGGGPLKLTFSEIGAPSSSANVPTSFSASEMLFSIRIYEPFRNLW